MQESLLFKVGLPASLFIIMLGMGLSLKVDDFRRVMKFPKAVAVGVLCQMLLLPAVGYAIVSLIELQQPELAVGLMILTFCPGGTTSNMLTFLARGAVALSITLTAFVSVVTPFTIPFLTAWSMTQLMGEGQAVQMPLVKTIAILLVITVIPVGIGMLINRKWEGAASKTEKGVKIFSVAVLVVIILALSYDEREHIVDWFTWVGPAALLLNVTTMGLGYGIARIAKLEKAQQTTVGMEVGIQNGTTALMVTGTLLAVPAMTIAPAVYSLIMFATGGVFGWLVNRGQPAPAAPSPVDT